MKKYFLILTVMLLPAGPTRAQIFQPSDARLDAKIRKASERFDIIQANPATRIPESILSSALGIIIIQQFKAGIVIGAEGGNGVALARNPNTRQWSPPAFVANAEGSYGWQIGAQNATTVFLIMQEEGMKLLRDGGVKFGVDVRATAGPRSRGGEAVIENVKSPVLVYSDREGLFAGIAVEGGGVMAAPRKNDEYYGMSLQEVLFSGKARWTQPGAELVNKLRSYETPAPAPQAPQIPRFPGYQPPVPMERERLPGIYGPGQQPVPSGSPGSSDFYYPEEPAALPRTA